MIQIHDIGEQWPEAISDGLTLACGVCGQEPSFDYLVADEAWEVVVPEELRLGVVCLACFDHLAGERGVHTSDVLEHVQFTGAGETIILHPVEAYRYGLRVVGDGASRMLKVVPQEATS